MRDDNQVGRQLRKVCVVAYKTEWKEGEEEGAKEEMGDGVVKRGSKSERRRRADDKSRP